jgi:hypothetical protein
MPSPDNAPVLTYRIVTCSFPYGAVKAARQMKMVAIPRAARKVTEPRATSFSRKLALHTVRARIYR